MALLLISWLLLSIDFWALLSLVNFWHLIVPKVYILIFLSLFCPTYHVFHCSLYWMIIAGFSFWRCWRWNAIRSDSWIAAGFTWDEWWVPRLYRFADGKVFISSFARTWWTSFRNSNTRTWRFSQWCSCFRITFCGLEESVSEIKFFTNWWL